MADVRLTATNPDDSQVYPVACNERGELRLEEIPDQSFDGNLQGDLNVSGSATFKGVVTSSTTGVAYALNSVNLNSDGYVYAKRDAGPGINVWVGSNESGDTSTIDSNGSAVFAAGKAGFTAEGNLFCTTTRGDLVVLTNTSGGFGEWAAYTPPSRRDELKDRWSEKNVLRPKPEDSSQDVPETPQ